MGAYSDMGVEQLRDTLEYLHDKYNTPSFIEADPISVPHSFSALRDREIAGFMAATIAWGNRKAIVRSAHRMMEYMDGAPYDFVCNASEQEVARLRSYVHRTFNGEDFTDFVLALRRICSEYGSLGELFQRSFEARGSVAGMLSDVRREFFAVEHRPHCEKHLSSIDKGTSCKRLNMYLRWFVRKDDRGVDFGAWERIPMSALMMPLDVHSGNMGRELGLLTRRQNDWKAVEQLTASLREIDATDPVRYDFALFGAGIDGFLKR
ncbi:MAG: TIGR02757 family protein [Alistipes sp.]|nr:TIGR02757 family protein [Alistipes sp.]